MMVSVPEFAYLGTVDVHRDGLRALKEARQDIRKGPPVRIEPTHIGTEFGTDTPMPMRTRSHLGSRFSNRIQGPHGPNF